MFRALLTCCFAVGLLAGGSALAADETYTLKLYKSKKGDKTENEKKEEGKTNVDVDFGGANKKEELPNGNKEVYTEEILEKKEGDRRPTKLTRKYTVAEKTDKNGTTKAVYSGKTVLIEKKGDKYALSVDGKELSKEDAPELYKSFNKKDGDPQNEDFLPKDAVKVGGGWKVPPEKSEQIFKSLGEDKMKVDVKKSTVSGKLLKVYKKDGAQFGVLEITVTALVTELELGEEQFIKTKEGSKLVIKATIDACIDGTIEFEDSKIDVTIDVSAELPNNGSLTITASSKGTEKTRAAKK
ncbi:hypothetical protein VT84_22955 [Gemmata sp. SH-PL17]|uniref:hypothetical protein n=1 Tax=Gemmata sp. SH-PL17 TaxID=1630693 RepID=UPI0004B05559|nr:hypothetical protein [Gemmata sp. SH-PL17]AMV27280.1 hypothetical protein VT84_22955 [Gemmata sp. SH-PL17]